MYTLKSIVQIGTKRVPIRQDQSEFPRDHSPYKTVLLMAVMPPILGHYH